MSKVYIESKRNDAELEQLIHDMDAYHLRIFLYGVARGWEFDEACSIAEEAAQHSEELSVCVCERPLKSDHLGYCGACGLPITPVIE